MPFGNLRTIENILKNIIYVGLPRRIEFLDGEVEESKVSDAEGPQSKDGKEKEND